jgi:hypothetical protein
MALSDPFFDVKIDTAASGDTTIISGTSGQTIKIWSLILWSAGAVNVILKDAATRNLTGAIGMVAQSRFILDETAHPWFTLTAGNAFVINLSTTIQVSGSVRYTKAA